MKTIAIIPARAGSKGVPDKNFRILGESLFKEGKNLVARALDAAKQAGLEVCVTTDSREWHLDAITRPEELSRDDTPIKPVIQHAAQELKLDPDDRIIMLYPIYPFRSHVDIRWIAEVTDGRDNPCIGITEQREHPSLAVWEDTLTPVAERTGYRRQDMRPCYRLTHWLSVFKVKHLADMDANLTQPAEHIRVPVERTLDIDTWQDWQVAQALLETGRGP